MTLPIAGEITAWAGELSADIEKKFEASGWLVCDGRAVDKKKYAELFNVIHNKYGTGQAVIPESFFLPDLGGRVAVGANPSSRAAINKLSVRGVGDVIGGETHKLTIDEMPKHNHGYTKFRDADTENVNRGYALHDYVQDRTGDAGGDLPHNNMQPSLVVTYLIRFKAG